MSRRTITQPVVALCGTSRRMANRCPGNSPAAWRQGPAFHKGSWRPGEPKRASSRSSASDQNGSVPVQRSENPVAGSAPFFSATSAPALTQPVPSGAAGATTSHQTVLPARWRMPVTDTPVWPASSVATTGASASGWARS